MNLCKPGGTLKQIYNILALTESILSSLEIIFKNIARLHEDYCRESDASMGREMSKNSKVLNYTCTTRV